ncbi:MAG: hypothetical protein JXA61_01595 [Bacteroidales bacterium]|nr:hypothetical protein [Bacteroidales bacterium]
MIDKNKCRLLGTLAKTHGIDGSLILRLSGFETDEIREPETVFIEIDGLLVPFFIGALRERSSREFIIRFIDVDSAEQARKLTGCNVFEVATIQRGMKTAVPEKSVKGYQVTDKRSGFKGTVTEILDPDRNPLLKVIREGQEFLIPFHRDIILEINNRKKTITIEAPDGLFDL